LKPLVGVAFRVASVTPQERQQKPPAPFTTSSLQQAASSHLKLSPDATMKLAQALYEAGHITYMRTDSPSVSPEGEKMAESTIARDYGDGYLGSHKYSAKGNAQEAHECIRPTDSDASPDAVRLALGAGGERAGDLYALIWRRFLASQMANAVFHEVRVTVSGGQAVFSAKGSQRVFDGFLRVYDHREESEAQKRADDEDDDAPNTALPPLTAGEDVQARALTPKQHHTQPPPRYSEALLVKALEQAGVGRPSTYAQTLATLKGRGYATVTARKLTATPLGKQVTSVLISQLPKLFDITFTADMETALDSIAAGKQDGRDYLKAFWAQVSPLFGESIVQATLSASAPKPKPANAPRQRTAQAKPAPTTSANAPLCPKCGKPLVKRTSARGDFWGCSGFPNCRFTQPL
jgi:DNA topoisomerase-1